MQLRPRKRRKDMPPAFFAALSPRTVSDPAPSVQVFNVPLEDRLRRFPLFCRDIGIVPEPVAEDTTAIVAFRQRGSRDHLGNQIAGTWKTGRAVKLDGL